MTGSNYTARKSFSDSLVEATESWLYISQRRRRSRNMKRTALMRMQSVHTVGTTISVTISMWPIRGSATHTRNWESVCLHLKHLLPWKCVAKNFNIKLLFEFLLNFPFVIQSESSPLLGLGQSWYSGSKKSYSNVLKKTLWLDKKKQRTGITWSYLII